MTTGPDARWATPFEQAPVPRRDVVPPPGFTKPPGGGPGPEPTVHIRPWEAARGRRAMRVTGASLVFLALVVFRLVWIATHADEIDLRLGLILYLAAAVIFPVLVIVNVVVWKRAARPAPPDEPR